MTFHSTENGNRFSGFSDIYNSARPAVPEYPIQILTRYLQRRPQTVVDIGCGTGLSTFVWQNHCNKVIGIEPNEDMLRVAHQLNNDKVSFIRAYSNETNLPSELADIVVCSQSFHWMEPTSTLFEIHRILNSGGIFATIDYDWPPVSCWSVEKACIELNSLTNQIEKEHTMNNPGVTRWDKTAHLDNIRATTLFRFTREIVFANTETCTADRLYAMALSQSALQYALKHCPTQIEPKLAEYKELLDNTYGQEPFEVDFCYRMRIGIK